MTQITCKSGKGREVNPHDGWAKPRPDYVFDTAKINPDWEQWNKSHPTLDCLTPNGEVAEDGPYEAELVWQLRANRDLVEAGIDTEIKWIKAYQPLAEEMQLANPESFRQVYIIQPTESGLDLNKLEKEVDDFIGNQTSESYNKMFAEMDKEQKDTNVTLLSKPADAVREKKLPPLIQHLADAIDRVDCKVTFGLQPDHINLIEAGINAGLSLEYTFENVAKQISWDKYTLACYYIKHLRLVIQHP